MSPDALTLIAYNIVVWVLAASLLVPLEELKDVRSTKASVLHALRTAARYVASRVVPASAFTRIALRGACGHTVNSGSVNCDGNYQ